MTGMEHSLQVLLSIIITLGLFDREFQQRNEKLFWIALISAPLVRYEVLSLSLPILLYLISEKESRHSASIALILLLAVLLSFSGFLYAHSGYFFPSSVMMKQSAVSELGGPGIIADLLRNSYNIFLKYGWLIFVAMMTVIYTNKFSKISVTFLSAILLFVLLGKQGWFGRYEVFFVMFLTLPVILMIEKAHGKFFENTYVALLALPFAFPTLALATLLTPQASSNVYNQQYLISRFVSEVDQGVAVNDLGLISFNSDKIVVDIFGLGSIDAMGARKRKEKGYVKRILEKNDVDLVIIYDGWLSKGEVDHLVRTAELTLTEPRITPASSTVVFYTSSPDKARLLQNQLKRFDFKKNKLHLMDVL